VFWPLEIGQETSECGKLKPQQLDLEVGLRLETATCNLRLQWQLATSN